MTEWAEMPRDAQALLLVFYAAKKANYNGADGIISFADAAGFAAKLNHLDRYGLSVFRDQLSASEEACSNFLAGKLP